MQESILFLDIAKSTGYSVYGIEAKGVIAHGTIKLNINESWGNGLKEFEEWLKKMLANFNIRCIVAEDVYIPYADENKNTKAFKRLCELHGILEKFIFENKLTSYFVAAKQHHLSLCGYKFKKRTDIKEETVRRIRRIFGESYVSSEDEADALSLMLFWLKLTRGELELYVSSGKNVTL